MYSQIEGMYVCKGGISTSETCGYIVDSDYDNLPVGEYTLDNQIEVDLRASRGDSGAAPFITTTLLTLGS